MNSNILISVIIPCYNQGVFLDESCLSILNQTYKNWEAIIVNDGSTDITEKIATNWAERDPRFKYFKQINGGLSKARNEGLNLATGNYILFLDADDCIHEDKLLKSLLEVNSKKADIIISDYRMFKSKVSKLKPSRFDLSKQEFTLESIILNWDTKFTIPIHCALFSSSLFKTVRFNETLKAKEDWYMWIEVFQQNPKVTYLGIVLSYYRKNPNSMTKNIGHMRRNTDLAYQQVLNIIDDKLKPVFLKKIFEDNTRYVIYFQKKYLKYKRYFYITLIMISILIFVMILIF